MFLQSWESRGSAGVSRHWPDTSNSQPWNAQRRPPFSSRPKARSAPRWAQWRSIRPVRPCSSRNSPRFSPSSLTALTGRGPCNSSTSAAGCQYIRISLPQGSLRPVRVIRSFASWLIMARGLREICSPIELSCDFNVGWVLGKRILEAAMPKLKRTDDGGNRGGTDFTESLDRGLRVLEVFGGSRQPMTLSDLAKAADLPRATARRILFTLERAGFVATDGKLFRLMPRVLVLASAYLASNHVVSVLQPALDRLSGEAQEISSMAILDGNDVVFIARASPTRIFSAGIDIGYRLPAFCTSVGRVLLSQLSDDELAALLDKMDLAPLTPLTVTDKKLLQKTIIADRAKGYSLVDREAEPGFRSISVPIRRYDGAIVAAINMGAHVDRVSSAEMIERFLPRLREAAASVKSMLV